MSKDPHIKISGSLISLHISDNVSISDRVLLDISKDSKIEDATIEGNKFIDPRLANFNTLVTHVFSLAKKNNDIETQELVKLLFREVLSPEPSPEPIKRIGHALSTV